MISPSALRKKTLARLEQRTGAYERAQAFGAELKAVREAAGVTQADLALWFEVAPLTVLRWENGQCFPKGERLALVREWMRKARRDYDDRKQEVLAEKIAAEPQP